MYWERVELFSELPFRYISVTQLVSFFIRLMFMLASNFFDIEICNSLLFSLSLQIHPIQASPIKVPFAISFHLSYLPMLPFDFEVNYVVRDFNCRCNSPATLAGSHLFFCWYILLEQSTYGVRGIMVNWCFIRLCHLVATFWWRELKKGVEVGATYSVKLVQKL